MGTPLIYSSHISDRLGCSAFLKLENLQPSQSFKYRGISLRVEQAKEQHGPAAHIFMASSGNAGLAAAVAARALQVRCTIYLPIDVAKDTQDVLRRQGAAVVLVGQNYSEALAAMCQAAKEDPNGLVLSSYDDPVLWKGHSSMVEEMNAQLRHRPDAIFCSVGGGGLIGGILVGCKSVGWDNVPIVALETHGSNCFYHAVSLNTQGFRSSTPSLPTDVVPLDAPYTVQIDEEHQVAVPHLHTLTSRAASLGASWPSPGVVRLALDHAGGVKCVCIPDELAMFAARGFADDHKFLLELACSTAMSPAYSCELFWRILDPTSRLTVEEKRAKQVVFVVCGGIKTDELLEYAQILERVAEWEVVCNRTAFSIRK